MISLKENSLILSIGWDSLVAQRLKHLPAMREAWVRSLGQEDPWRNKWHPTPVFFPGESHGWRSLVGYSPQGRKESDATERLHFHALEENSNPLQYCCLENPRDGGDWWVAVYGVAPSQTGVK